MRFATGRKIGVHRNGRTWLGSHCLSVIPAILVMCRRSWFRTPSSSYKSVFSFRRASTLFHSHSRLCQHLGLPESSNSWATLDLKRRVPRFPQSYINILHRVMLAGLWYRTRHRFQLRASLRAYLPGGFYPPIKYYRSNRHLSPRWTVYRISWPTDVGLCDWSILVNSHELVGRGCLSVPIYLLM